MTNGICFVAGEITTNAYVDIAGIARSIIKEVGYTGDGCGFDYEASGVAVAIKEQSSDIAQGVDSFKHDKSGKITDEHLENLGAGDQGCIKEGAWIRTKDGFKLIENVKVGDFVATPEGFHKIKKKVCTGTKKILGLVFSNGYRLACTPDHKIMCYLEHGELSWKEAQQLTNRDFICSLKPNQSFCEKYIESKVLRSQFFTKYNHKIFGNERVALNEEAAYLLGLIIGDGCATKKNYIEIAFGKNKNLALAASQIAHKVSGANSRLIISKDSINVKIDSVVFRKHLENFGVGYLKSPQKNTPLAILNSPRKTIVAYLRGLFDSDGTIVSDTGRSGKNIRIRLGSSSLKLLQETQLLLNEFNIKTSLLLNALVGKPVGKDPKYSSNYDNYVLSLSGFDSYQNFCREIGFDNSQKEIRAQRYLSETTSKPKNSRGINLVPHRTKDEMIDETRLGKCLPFSIVKLKSKKDAGLSTVYDLEIDKVHMFSANGIYVHNCMFGYATNETPELMPLPIVLSHRLCQRLAEVRKKNIIKGLRPDGKSQVTVEYDGDIPQRIHTVLIAAQHEPDKKQAQLKKEITEKVIRPVLAEYNHKIDSKTKIYVNTTGKFVIGGPQGDTGLTGRKIIVDTYGGMARHGGGALSGKDPSKVDRSGCYAARWVAKNVVGAKLADKCEVQIAYAIGIPEPLSISVNTFGTAKIADGEIVQKIMKVFDLRPGMIIKELNLRRPIYRQVAAYGHFGRKDLNLPWEKVDMAKKLK